MASDEAHDPSQDQSISRRVSIGRHEGARLQTSFSLITEVSRLAQFASPTDIPKFIAFDGPVGVGRR
jgi:hypothetical protein